MGMSIGTKTAIWDPIIREEVAIGHASRETGIILIDEPAPPSPKPFREAVGESWRGIKDWYNGPETSQKTDGSVREHVNAEIDKQIDKNEKLKPFPGVLP